MKRSRSSRSGWLGPVPERRAVPGAAFADASSSARSRRRVLPPATASHPGSETVSSDGLAPSRAASRISAVFNDPDGTVLATTMDTAFRRVPASVVPLNRDRTHFVLEPLDTHDWPYRPELHFRQDATLTHVIVDMTGPDSPVPGDSGFLCTAVRRLVEAFPAVGSMRIAVPESSPRVGAVLHRLGFSGRGALEPRLDDVLDAWLDACVAARH